jgi:hypothetical protein
LEGGIAARRDLENVELWLGFWPERNRAGLRLRVGSEGRGARSEKDRGQGA